MKWGGDSIGKIQWGSSVIGKVYHGSNLVYDAGGGPTPPVNPYRTLDGIVFDGHVYYKIPGFHLQGSDTLKFSFNVTGNCNVIGCYTSASAQDNYSLFVSTSSSAKYLRYNGGAYNSRIYTGRKVDVTITPTGSSGLRSNSTWSSKTFTSSADFCIGTTSDNASVTSSYLVGAMYGNVEIVGRETFVPVERIADGAIGYLGQTSGYFYTNQGSGTPTELT